jgi:large subunit ribosomal protein L10
MERQAKVALVESIRTELAESPSVVLVDFNGLNVENAVQFRRECLQAGVRFKVIKNRLIGKAVEGTDHEVVSPLLVGMTGIAWAESDPVGPAKVVAKFAKEHEAQMRIKGGALQGELLDAEGVKNLSTMPGLDELRSKLLGLFNAPAQKLLAQIEAPAQKLVGTIQAYVDDQEAA